MRRGYPVFDPSAPLSLGVAINISSSLCLSECVCVGMCTCVEEAKAMFLFKKKLKKRSLEEAKAMLRAALHHLENETFKRTRSVFLVFRTPLHHPALGACVCVCMDVCVCVCVCVCL